LNESGSLKGARSVQGRRTRQRKMLIRIAALQQASTTRWKLTFWIAGLAEVLKAQHVLLAWYPQTAYVPELVAIKLAVTICEQ
jgi:hypothetical protein